MSLGVFFGLLLLTSFVTNGRCEDDNNPTDEASLLALEVSGQLLAPKSLTQKLAEELKAIRGAYPAVSTIICSPPWVVGELLAQVSDKQLEQIRSQYGDVRSEPLSDQYMKLTFATKYNPVVLAEELISKKLVTSAEPNSFIGERDSVQYNAETGVYTFRKGWGDCPSGCINKHYWEFSVSQSKAVQLIKEYGTPLRDESDN